MEGTLRRVRSPPAALWTETLDNLWRINWFLRSFSLWARHSAETSAELNVRSGAAEFFPVASRQVRATGSGGEKDVRRRWMQQQRVKTRLQETIQRSVRQQSRCHVALSILFLCPAQLTRSFLRSFSLWARHPAETSAELN